MHSYIRNIECKFRNMIDIETVMIIIFRADNILKMNSDEYKPIDSAMSEEMEAFTNNMKHNFGDLLKIAH